MNSDTWTPDKRIMAFKEVVSAGLGLLIVGATVCMAFVAFSSDAQGFANTKEVLTLMYGLAGVVLGYYFGRIPADARAVQAQDQADAATARTQKMGTKIEQAMADVDKVVKEMETRALTTGDIGGHESEIKQLEQMRNIRDEMRNAMQLSRDL